MAYLTRQEKIFLPDQDGNLGTYRIKSQIGTVQFRYTFVVPSDYRSLILAKLDGDVSPGAAGTNRNIDLFISSHGDGEPENQKTASDTAGSYDLSAYSNKRYPLVFTSLLSVLNPSAGDTVGLNIDHNSIGGTIYYMDLILIYSRKF
jgi:hypothetical protein